MSASVCVYVCVCLCVCVYLTHVCISVQDQSVFVIQLLNGVGDFIDLRYVLNPRLRPDFHHMSLEQIKRYTALNGHCSVLVKVLLCLQ